MDDRIRVSDADRERVTARLRDHYAEGRLTAEELDERTSAALNAKTFGDLRRPMADLPDPAPDVERAKRLGAAAAWDTRALPLARAPPRPRFAPLLMLALLFVVLAPGPGAWVLFGFAAAVPAVLAGDRPGGVRVRPAVPAAHVPGRPRRLPATAGHGHPHWE